MISSKAFNLPITSKFIMVFGISPFTSVDSRFNSTVNIEYKNLDSLAFLKAVSIMNNLKAINLHRLLRNPILEGKYPPSGLLLRSRSSINGIVSYVRGNNCKINEFHICIQDIFT